MKKKWREEEILLKEDNKTYSAHAFRVSYIELYKI